MATNNYRANILVCGGTGCTASGAHELVDNLQAEINRQGLAREIEVVPTGCRGLLVTLEYPQAEKAGPPFSVPEDEVHSLYDQDWEVELLEHRPIPPDHPGFVAGVSRLDTAVYALRRR